MFPWQNQAWLLSSPGRHNPFCNPAFRHCLKSTELWGLFTPLVHHLHVKTTFKLLSLNLEEEKWNSAVKWKMCFIMTGAAAVIKGRVAHWHFSWQVWPWSQLMFKKQQYIYHCLRYFEPLLYQENRLVWRTCLQETSHRLWVVATVTIRKAHIRAFSVLEQNGGPYIYSVDLSNHKTKYKNIPLTMFLDEDNKIMTTLKDLCNCNL